MLSDENKALEHQISEILREEIGAQMTGRVWTDTPATQRIMALLAAREEERAKAQAYQLKGGDAPSQANPTQSKTSSNDKFANAAYSDAPELSAPGRSQHPASDCPSGGGWRPIESAPKDGSSVLVYRDGEAHVARWNCGALTNPQWVVSPPQLSSNIVRTCVGIGPWLWHDREVAAGPTHWQPLPEPPQPKAPAHD